jgi:hypothetical protein
VLHFDGARWRVDDAASSLTKASLHAIAFDASGNGFAVGSKGTILSYDGTSWALDPQSGAVARRLDAIAANGTTFVAVGEKGTILERAGGTWKRRKELEGSLISGQEGEDPNLLSVAARADGGFLIGGARSVLIERAPDGALTLAPRGAAAAADSTAAGAQDSSAPGALARLEGTVNALAVSGADVVASIGTESSRFNGENLAQASGWPQVGDARGWHDLSFAHVSGISPLVDAPVLRDAVMSIAMDGRAGWAVGGFPANVFDDDGHLRSTSTASVWRIDLDGPAAASPEETGAQIPPGRGLGFAFLGNTACATGSCATALGSGTAGDEIARAALRQIEDAAQRGEVSFLAFGGDQRRNGVPDELNGMRALFDDLSVPVFATVGAQDLFAGPASSVGSAGVLDTNGYFLDAYRRAPQPFGQGARLDGFRPVSIGAAADATKARTHFAFDVLRAGVPVARLVFLDTSKVPLASNVQAQNPAEDETTWLQNVAADARLKNVPWIGVMNQPLLLPISTAADASVLTPIFTAGGASAVLASHLGTNQIVSSPSTNVPGALPLGVFGSGGGALTNGYDPARGAYRAWQLVNVDASKRNATGQAPVSMRSIPILESVAIHSEDGWTGEAGHAMRFTGIGRAPDTGGASALGAAPAQDEGRATYIRFPFPAACAPLQTANCRPAGVVVPEHRFVSSDPSVAEFVRAGANGRPFRDAAGNLVRDPSSGLLCTFRPGTVSIGIDAGVAGARMPLQVGGGSGPCIPGTIADTATARPVVAGAKAPRPANKQSQTLLHVRPPDQAAVGAVAPPIVNVAPAPPGGGAARKEEQEAASERSEMTAVRHGAAPGRTEPLLVLGMLVALAYAGAALARPRPKPQPSAHRARIPGGNHEARRNRP